MSPAKSRHHSPGEHDEGAPAVTGLERRYVRWTALFYPAGYRRERGSELLDTYLSLAAPGRRRPSPADIADLAAGGLRQHLRMAQGLGPGFRLAGLIALITATVFATGSMAFEVLTPKQPWYSHVGPFQTLAAAAWAAWILAAVAHVAASGRWLRWTVSLAVLVTAGVVPAAMLTGLPRPPLALLLPQLVLGVVALGAADRHPWRIRLIPITATTVTLPVAIDTAPDLDYYTGYSELSRYALPAAAVTLLLGALLLALGLAARRDYRGAWAMLILLTPIGMLAVNPLGAAFDDSGPGRGVIPAWSAMVVASVLIAVIGPMLVLLALAVRGRLSPGRRPPGAESTPSSP
jgi:hypothetical protein